MIWQTTRRHRLFAYNLNAENQISGKSEGVIVFVEGAQVMVLPERYCCIETKSRLVLWLGLVLLNELADQVDGGLDALRGTGEGDHAFVG